MIATVATRVSSNPADANAAKPAKTGVIRKERDQSQVRGLCTDVKLLMFFYNNVAVQVYKKLIINFILLNYMAYL
jgi:hypothetical protein